MSSAQSSIKAENDQVTAPTPTFDFLARTWCLEKFVFLHSHTPVELLLMGIFFR